VCEFDDVCASVVAFAQVGRCDVTISAAFGRPVEPGGSAACSKQVTRFFGAVPLFFDRYVVFDPGGMLFDRKAGARGAAKEMARHLAAVRPELRNGGGWIRVRDIKRNEVHRLAIDPDVRPNVPAQRRTVTLIAAE
jgi:hypothetical protein